MAQRVLPHWQHGHRLDGTLQDGKGQGKLLGLAAHLDGFDPVGPAKQQRFVVFLLRLKS